VAICTLLETASTALIGPVRTLAAPSAVSCGRSSMVLSAWEKSPSHAWRSARCATCPLRYACLAAATGGAEEKRCLAAPQSMRLKKSVPVPGFPPHVIGGSGGGSLLPLSSALAFTTMTGCVRTTGHVGTGAGAAASGDGSLLVPLRLRSPAAGVKPVGSV
jgi:hypothetical protein